MNTSASLSMKTVLIMRAEAQAKEMARAVMKRGGIPLEIPLLHIVPAETGIPDLHSYTWIIFTSQNGVRYFLQAVDTLIPSSVKVAAVGMKTKQELEKHGCTVHFVPSKFEAATFVHELIPLLGQGDCILFPKGNLAKDTIPAALKERGIIVHEEVVYVTEQNSGAGASLIEALQGECVDAIAFTSPSTVTAFVSLLEGTNWREWIKRCTIACIGPVTEREAAHYFSSLVIPDVYTIDGLLDALAAQYCKKV